MAIEAFSVLKTTKEIEELANEYIKYKAIPEAYSEEDYHIAIATINEMDYLLI